MAASLFALKLGLTLGGAIVGWMLAKDPAKRYPTPERAAQALKVFLAAGMDAPAAAPVDAIALPPSRRGRRRVARPDPRMEAVLSEGDDPLLAPLRVVWLAPERPGRGRAVSLAQLLTSGDPRDPGPWRQRRILRRQRERCRIVAGEPAPLSELRERWLSAGEIGRAHV